MLLQNQIIGVPNTPDSKSEVPAKLKALLTEKQRPGATQGKCVAELMTSFIEAIGSVLSDTQKKKIAAELLRHTKQKPQETKGITLGRLCRLYCDHAKHYYPPSDTRTTSETSSIELATRPLKKLFARSRVMDFGPRKLCKVRDEMIGMGWCRKHINQQIGRIKRMFKWAVENETIPASCFHSIQPLAGLRAGRSEAKESVPVKPVPEPWIEAVLPFVSPQVKAMIQLQLITGMRPGEVCTMRTCDIDINQQPWLYRPEHHKTEYHDHERSVFLGPKCQEIVKPFLRSEKPIAYIFSPAQADKIRRKKLHAARKTPMSCGNRPGTNRKRHPKRSPGDRYDTASYRRAITYATENAFPAPDGLDAEQAKEWRREHNWHPHQLRHNAATRIRKEFGIDVAQVVLGHKTLAVTQVYAEKDVAAAQKIMLQAG